MLSEAYLQQVINSKDTESALDTGQNVGWATVDGALVIYDLDSPPWWFPKRDINGNSVLPQAIYAEPEPSELVRQMQDKADERAAFAKATRKAAGLDG